MAPLLRKTIRCHPHNVSNITQQYHPAWLFHTSSIKYQTCHPREGGDLFHMRYKYQQNPPVVSLFKQSLPMNKATQENKTDGSPPSRGWQNYFRGYIGWKGSPSNDWKKTGKIYWWNHLDCAMHTSAIKHQTCHPCARHLSLTTKLVIPAKAGIYSTCDINISKIPQWYRSLNRAYRWIKRHKRTRQMDPRLRGDDRTILGVISDEKDPHPTIEKRLEKFIDEII